MPIDRVSEDLWSAIENAVNSGWSWEKLKKFSKEAWIEAMRDQIKDVEKDAD